MELQCRGSWEEDQYIFIVASDHTGEPRYILVGKQNWKILINKIIITTARDHTWFTNVMDF